MNPSPTEPIATLPSPACGGGEFAFLAMIERAARDPTIDVDKLDRLLQMRERENARVTEQAFNAALADAQTEMHPVAADSDNPQTRSRYASYAALDRAVRPIYTKHGFALSFNTADAPGPEQARICPHRLHRIRGPNDGTATASGQASMLTAVSWPQCRQVTNSPRTPFWRMLPSVIGWIGSSRLVIAAAPPSASPGRA